MEAMQPEFEDETPINPFDFWQGANFKLKLKKVAGYWNYDSSEFDRPSALLDDDDALEAIWKKEQSLTERLLLLTSSSPTMILITRLNYVLGTKSTRKATVEEETEYDNYAAQETKQVSEEQVMEKLEQSYQASKETTTTVETDDEDPMSYFAKLAES